MTDMAAAPLSNGSLQVWAVDHDNKVRSRWKTDNNWDAPWTDWSDFPLPAPLTSLAAAPLSDGRLQLFALDVNGTTWTCWKETTQADAPWTEWSPF